MNEFNPQLIQPLPWLPPVVPGPVAVTPSISETSDTFESNAEHSDHKTGIVSRGIQEAKMHTAATILMGVGSLLMNFIPGFKMSWSMASKMAVANMAMMVMIAFGLGAYKASKGEAEHKM